MLTLARIQEAEIVLMGILIGGVIVVAVIGILSSAVRDVLRSKHQEESRREIAAYVAEGSIAPDDAAKLLASGGSLKDRVVKRLGL